MALFCDRLTPRDTGFTLLEAVIGLAIVAIGFALAFTAMPESLSAQQDAGDLEAAAALAESLLAEATISATLPGSGRAGRLAWRVDAVPLADAGGMAAQQLRIDVNWLQGGRDRAILVQSVRLSAMPQQP